jgi:hypothetical protein
MYLIMECKELGDQWECDADRSPVCLVEDCSKYGVGYEVYKVLEDGTFRKIKGYDETLERGMAVYFWQDGVEAGEPTIREKWKNMKRGAMTESKIQRLKNKYGFHDTVEEMLHNIHCSGMHGESINNKWYVIGEYCDNIYDMGY